MNWKAFLQGILGAAIGGAATSISSVLIDPAHADFHHLGPIAGAGALIGVVGLLKQSPIVPIAPTPTTNDPTPPVSNFPTTR